MFDLIKKTMLTGIGLALKTKDEVENLAEELIKQGKLSETEGSKFLEELRDKYEDSQKKLEKRVEKTVKELLKKANLVTSDELNALKKEIRELKKAVSEKA
jgi:polyhydroxyalkanoate synthesis regulator phasin